MIVYDLAFEINNYRIVLNSQDLNIDGNISISLTNLS